MRDDYALRLLIERLQRQGASEQAIVTAVREAIHADDELATRRRPARPAPPARGPLRLLRRAA